MSGMRLIVCGSRNWCEPWLVRDYFEEIRQKFDPPHDRIVIVHGAGRGLDKMAGLLAERAGFTVEPHRADWNRYGKAAGPIRNAEMADLGADGLVAWKDGLVLPFVASAGFGTEGMIDLALRAGIPVEAFNSKGERYEIPPCGVSSRG